MEAAFHYCKSEPIRLFAEDYKYMMPKLCISSSLSILKVEFAIRKHHKQHFMGACNNNEIQPYKMHDIVITITI